MQRRSFLAATGSVALGGCGEKPSMEPESSNVPSAPVAPAAPAAPVGPGAPPGMDVGVEPPESALSELDLLFEMVRLRHGARLMPEQLADIRRELAANLASAARLRAVPLENRDEPVFAPLWQPPLAPDRPVNR